MDLLEIDPIPGAILMQGDFLAPDAPDRIKTALNGEADLVLSDMSPSTTGHTATDHIRIMALTEVAADFAFQILAPNGAFVAKVFQGGAEKAFLQALQKNFTKVRHVKPPASRPESPETYVVATGFRG
jgi:23S rRNA (uridine2552-2'-O)-methyltransferase